MQLYKQFATAGLALTIIVGIVGCAPTTTSLGKQANKTISNNTGSNATTQLAWGIPANIAWNGYYYQTQGSTKTIGSKLGVATYPGPIKVFRIPGKNPEKTVVVDAGPPKNKYIVAVRVPVGTKSSPIPDNWMTLNTLNPDAPIQSGSKIALSGTVFFRELYGTTIEIGLKRQGPKYPTLVTKKLVVSNNGTVSGTLNVPNGLSGQPNKTQYLLDFRDTSQQYQTTPYSFPMLFK
ncbi:hypothetical protein [Alicyclobacillus sp. SP_1]|uniref:hypothetical protein n=1 Tax=Alicyclobacillus sp. SP_1 TaxID=2942475 RepID=UPI0021577D0D|nr:hypothetical protein [Alicyclobacillus sp. SP_1]